MAKKDFEELVLKSLKGLHKGQTELQGSVQGLQQGQTELQGSVRRLEVLHEEMSEKIDQIIEVISPEMVKNNEQDSRLDDHDQQLLAQSGRLNILEAA